MQDRNESNCQIEVLYDGDCPLCSREIKFMRLMDKHDSIVATDISDPNFDASTTGIEWSDLMDRIHGRRADGVIVEGVEVFRQLYSAVGWGWLVSITRIPGIRQGLDAAYAVFARNRLRLTNRRAESGRAPS